MRTNYLVLSVHYSTATNLQLRRSLIQIWGEGNKTTLSTFTIRTHQKMILSEAANYVFSGAQLSNSNILKLLK